MKRLRWNLAARPRNLELTWQLSTVITTHGDYTTLTSRNIWSSIEKKTSITTWKNEAGSAPMRRFARALICLSTGVLKWIIHTCDIIAWEYTLSASTATSDETRRLFVRGETVPAVCKGRHVHSRVGRFHRVVRGPVSLYYEWRGVKCNSQSSFSYVTRKERRKKWATHRHVLY